MANITAMERTFRVIEALTLLPQNDNATSPAARLPARLRPVREPAANTNHRAKVLPFKGPKAGAARHSLATAPLCAPWLMPVMLPLDVVDALHKACGEGEKGDWKHLASFFLGTKVGELLWGLAEHFAKRPLGARGKLSVPDAVLYVTTRTLPEGR